MGNICIKVNIFLSLHISFCSQNLLWRRGLSRTKQRAGNSNRIFYRKQQKISTNVLAHSVSVNNYQTLDKDKFRPIESYQNSEAK